MQCTSSMARRGQEGLRSLPQSASSPALRCAGRSLAARRFRDESDMCGQILVMRDNLARASALGPGVETCISDLVNLGTLFTEAYIHQSQGYH